MYQETALETTAKVGNFPFFTQVVSQNTISSLVPTFLRHGQFELSFAVQTIKKYEECLGMIVRDIGDLSVEAITLTNVTELKQKIIMRGAGDARVASMIFALKSLLKFCRENLELEVLDYRKIKSPKRRRREVLFLTPEEIQQFIDAIKYQNKTREKLVRMDGLRFRTLVEVLLGTGMRISEALSLNRDSIDLGKKEAKIIGKGSKERTVFFSDRCLEWVNFYLEEREDKEPPLFLTQKYTRLSKVDVSSLFKRYAIKAGLNKKITPHILRHTAATTLLFNGCPISHVKEILGHSRLETTCKYYLGVDKRKAKEAHGMYLKFDIEKLPEQAAN